MKSQIWTFFLTDINLRLLYSDIYPLPLHVDGLVQDCGNPISNALESLQFCSKPWIYVCPLGMPKLLHAIF